MLIVQLHVKICVVNHRVLKYAHLRVGITVRAVVRAHAPDLLLDLAMNVQTTVLDLVQGGVKMHAQRLVRNPVRVDVKDPVMEDAKDLV